MFAYKRAGVVINRSHADPESLLWSSERLA